MAIQSTKKPTTKRRIHCSIGWSCHSAIMVSYVVVSLLFANVKAETPIQIRIDPFWISLASTERQSPLSLPDIDAIHWDAEDVVEAYVRSEYGDSPETDFRYSALALVRELPELATNNTTGLQFSGGVAYFGGDSRIFPTQTQLQELVEAALDPDGQLLSMLHQSGYESFTSIAFGSGTYDPNLVAGLTLGDTTAVVEEVARLGMMMVVSTSAVGLLILCCVVLVVFSVENQKRRQAYLDGVARSSTQDSSFEDEGPVGQSSRGTKRKKGKQKKETSLHQLDSLKDNVHASSETGSNNVEQLLKAAVCAAERNLRSLPSSDSESDVPLGINREDDQTVNNNSKGSNDSTASMDIEDNGSLSNSEVVRCQNIQPKVVPVNKFADHFHDWFDFSFLGSTAPKSENQASKELMKPVDKTRSQSIQDAILRCCVMPFSDSAGPFGNDPASKCSRSKSESPISAVTEKTLQLDEAERFSTVSSGYKTDDFSPDEHWDPDDNSVGGLNDGVDAFSPLKSPVSAGGESDKAELLKYQSKSKYELTPLRTSPLRPSTRIPYNVDV